MGICLGFTDEFFLFDTTVLEPDSNLSLREVGGCRDPPSFVFGNELAGRILFLQLFQLDFGVGDALFAASTIAADFWL